jgi:hypothetical protein
MIWLILAGIVALWASVVAWHHYVAPILIRRRRRKDPMWRSQWKSWY